MGFSLKKAAGFVANPFAAASAAGLSSLGGLDPVQTTQNQVPLETPEQRAARIKLNEFSNTGKFGNFTAGEEIPLGYGDYGVTAPEQQGLSSLQQLLASGTPEGYRLGDEALKSILDGSQANIDAQFNPFKDQVTRQTRDAVNAAKASAGYMGNLYSTDAIKRLGDVQARGNETLASQLASLTNEALNRRLQAVPLAYQSANGQEAIQQGRIAASQQYGGLTRNLNDAKIKARDAEILRRRQELMLPIDAAKSVAGTNANFGVPSVTTQTPSTLMQLLQLGIQGGSMLMGARGAG